MTIEPADAVAIARRVMGEPEDAPASVAENADGYLVSFDDGGSSVATMSKVWLWVDKATGEATPVGGGVVSRLADTLRPLGL